MPCLILKNSYATRLLLLLLIILMPLCATAAERLRLATTTSTDNSGLLELLLPPFEQAYHCEVDVIAVGTGRALRLGEKGDVDVVLVHAREKEDAFIAAGYGVERRDVMYNDFVLIGPAADPAQVAELKDVAAAFGAIMQAETVFVSRGDESGTHFREMQLWQAAGVEPQGPWYLEAGRGMGEVLIMADESRGYALTDRGTYLAFKDKIALKVLLSGDSRLFNPYGVMAVNPAKHPHVKSELASAFCEYLASDQAKAIIRSFRKGGEPLFYVED
ncbi:MAG: substrate-binding domain-containing protein [Desulfuromonadales bacterium]|nr:substrate-binding domain-containing protein [Desulfuromonadales bacterium]